MVASSVQRGIHNPKPVRNNVHSSTVQHIDIKNVFVKSIPSNWLRGCFSLDKIILKTLSISEVPENLFELQVLVLKENWLKSLNPELFTDLFMLNHIDLSKNPY